MQLNNLKTKFLGQNTFYINAIDSTQSEIWRLYKKQAPTGTLVFADIQTKGKGTHGRTWHTSQAENIAFSFLINNNFNIEKLDGITIEIAEIIVDIFKRKYNIQIKIKKPNDLIYNNKKLGGILTETKILGTQVTCIVIGIGINTNQIEFPEDIKNTATSIKKEFNITVDTKEFIAEFCNVFEKQFIERMKK